MLEINIVTAILDLEHSIYVRELKNHDEVHDDNVCWMGKDWNENVSFGGKKET